MKLTSGAFHDGETIPRRYTCDGDNISPLLAWGDPPAGTRSFVLVCDDPDAPGGLWHHWAVFDIPPDQKTLAEHLPRTDPPGGPRQARNDFRRNGYDGPCPPEGHGAHRYRFRLLALSVARLPLKGRPTCAAVEAAARNHALAEADLVGLYER